MPAFGDDQITSSDLEALIRYLKGDYAEARAGAAVALSDVAGVGLACAELRTRLLIACIERLRSDDRASFPFALPQVGKARCDHLASQSATSGHFSKKIRDLGRFFLEIREVPR